MTESIRAAVRHGTVLQGNQLSWAVLSQCGRYRYALGRSWSGALLGRRPDAATTMVFIMLNPSTADGLDDDPTIRRCIGFADRHGHSGIAVVNLFAWRETFPVLLPKDEEAIGPDNERYLVAALSDPETTAVAAWGALSRGQLRLSERMRVAVGRAAPRLKCLGTTQGGDPRHPVRLPYATPLVDYRP